MDAEEMLSNSNTVRNNPQLGFIHAGSGRFSLLYLSVLMGNVVRQIRNLASKLTYLQNILLNEHPLGRKVGGMG